MTTNLLDLDLDTLDEYDGVEPTQISVMCTRTSPEGETGIEVIHVELGALHKWLKHDARFLEDSGYTDVEYDISFPEFAYTVEA